MTIGEAIASVKALKGLQNYDEISTKQTITLQVFHILGWNIFSRDEVIPEYAVESRRVDYSLSFMNESLVFMELLGKDNVIHGNALVSAERIHQNRKKVETIRTTLPEAWNNLIGAPHPSLIELLADATEKKG